MFFESSHYWIGRCWCGYDHSSNSDPWTTWRIPAEMIPAPRATPHKCPVCEGRGNVAADFYGVPGVSIGANPQQCRSCFGTGILWR